MDTIKIITNHHRIPLVYWYELTEKERKEFDYLETQEDQDSATFFRYRRNTYDMGEFERIDKNTECFKGWDGKISDTFFSGILVKWIREEWGEIDTEFIQAALFLA
jgi:hypothetical protein